MSGMWGAAPGGADCKMLAVSELRGDGDEGVKDMLKKPEDQ